MSELSPPMAGAPAPAPRRARATPRAAVNLARRPFANRRPIARLAVALWVLAVALLATNAALYWRSFFGIEGKREELAEVERVMATERAAAASAEEALLRMRLRQQNEEVAFLNHRIAARAFPWSALFEDLATVLPRGVRLFSLAPQASGQEGSVGGARARTQRAAARVVEGGVLLQMTGAAETDEALHELLDRLFASQRFAAPSLPRESREGGQLRFALDVYYLPADRVAAPGPAPGEPLADPAAGAEVAAGREPEAEEGP